MKLGGTLYFVLVFNLTIILKYLFYFDISFPIFYSYNKLLKNEDIILGEGRCAEFTVWKLEVQDEKAHLLSFRSDSSWYLTARSTDS